MKGGDGEVKWGEDDEGLGGGMRTEAILESKMESILQSMSRIHS